MSWKREIQSFSVVSPLRPTLLHPLGVRPALCKCHSKLSLSLVTSKRRPRLKSQPESDQDRCTKLLKPVLFFQIYLVIFQPAHRVFSMKPFVPANILKLLYFTVANMHLSTAIYSDTDSQNNWNRQRGITWQPLESICRGALLQGAQRSTPVNSESCNLALMERRPCVNQQRAWGIEGGWREGGREGGGGVAYRDIEKVGYGGKVSVCVCACVHTSPLKQGWGLKGLTVSCLTFFWCNQYMPDMLFGKKSAL